MCSERTGFRRVGVGEVWTGDIGGDVSRKWYAQASEDDVKSGEVAKYIKNSQ